MQVKVPQWAPPESRPCHQRGTIPVLRRISSGFNTRGSRQSKESQNKLLEMQVSAALPSPAEGHSAAPIIPSPSPKRRACSGGLPHSLFPSRDLAKGLPNQTMAPAATHQKALWAFFSSSTHFVFPKRRKVGKLQGKIMQSPRKGGISTQEPDLEAPPRLSLGLFPGALSSTEHPAAPS